MKLVVGGVRGTTPVCRPDFMKFGGETTSLLLEGSRGESVLVDAGTGIRTLGSRLERAGASRDVLLLMTHFHLDHVVGLPALSLLYDSAWSIEMASPMHQGLKIEDIMTRLMDKPFWPLQVSELGSHVRFRTLPGEDSGKPLVYGSMEIRWCPLHHPGGCTAYRVDDTGSGASVVIATDVEWAQASAKARQSLVTLVKEPAPASLLVMDGQFTAEEYEAHRGWGHSAWQECVEVAKDGGASSLLVTHHSPSKNDKELDRVAGMVRRAWRSADLARQGQEIVLGAAVRQAAPGG